MASMELCRVLSLLVAVLLLQSDVGDGRAYLPAGSNGWSHIPASNGGRPVGGTPPQTAGCPATRNMSCTCNTLQSLVDCSGLRLQSVPIFINRKTSFNKLDLSDNGITQLDANAFRFGNVYRLDLSKNAINSIAEMAFKGMTKLRELNMKGNQLCHIPEHTFIQTPVLSSLILDRNIIKFVSKDFFDNTFITKISLAGNFLTNITIGKQLSKNLLLLNLENNYLKNFEFECEATSPLFKLMLDGNPMLSCSLRDKLQSKLQPNALTFSPNCMQDDVVVNAHGYSDPSTGTWNFDRPTADTAANQACDNSTDATIVILCTISGFAIGILLSLLGMCVYKRHCQKNSGEDETYSQYMLPSHRLSTSRSSLPSIDETCPPFYMAAPGAPPRPPSTLLHKQVRPAYYSRYIIPNLPPPQLPPYRRTPSDPYFTVGDGSMTYGMYDSMYGGINHTIDEKPIEEQQIYQTVLREEMGTNDKDNEIVI